MCSPSGTRKGCYKAIAAPDRTTPWMLSQGVNHVEPFQGFIHDCQYHRYAELKFRILEGDFIDESWNVLKRAVLKPKAVSKHSGL